MINFVLSCVFYLPEPFLLPPLLGKINYGVHLGRHRVISLTAIFSFLFLLRILLIYLREKKRKRERAWGGAEGEGQEESALSAEPNVGPDLTTLRLWPQPKSRAGCSNDWVTQVSLTVLLSDWVNIYCSHTICKIFAVPDVPHGGGNSCLLGHEFSHFHLPNSLETGMTTLALQIRKVRL